jgi:hypothetical protein
MRRWQNRLMRVRQTSSGLVLAAVLAVAACTSAPPDRHAQVDQLTQQLRAMPGVVTAGNTFGDNAAQGPAFFEVDLEVADNVAADQLAAITAAYLDDLRAVDYTGYRAQLDVRRDGSVFVVDEPLARRATNVDEPLGRPVSNRDQILAQARSWVALRQQFAGSAITLRAAVGNDGDPPGRSPVTSGTIELPDVADYTAVAAAVGTLASTFGDLATGDWRISAGKQHPAEIRTTRRLPTAQEMELWNTLNADQSIPHADVFTINGAVTGPLWVSEKIPADDNDMAVRLAQHHLPLVARLLPPVLYSATNQYQGHIGFHGQATGPVTILIGGCMPRDFRPSPAEQALVDRYETCRR